MKPYLLSTLLLAMLFSVNVAAQNTIKLFDATPVTLSDTSYPWNSITPYVFASKDVYLSCPLGGSSYAYLTGPDNGDLIVDNFFTMNGNSVCPDDWNCFNGVFVMPDQVLGMPMESAYYGVPPIDVSDRLNGSGVYSFVLSDYSYSYGNNDIYLHTSCSLGTYVCHRNKGKAPFKTLAISGNMLAAHLGHGDTEGPCE